MYTKYNYNKNASEESQHVRTELFFIFINNIDMFLSYELASFAKFTFRTFKGVKTAIKTISSTRSVEFIPRTSFRKDSILNPTESYEVSYERHLVGSYNVFYKFVNTLITYKFHINTIIYRNNYMVKNGVSNNLKIIANFIKITWYNKIHNSVLNPTKSITILYLRAARHFNKGRYSRNRQLYRTGVY
jgi:hypothetical protein